MKHVIPIRTMSRRITKLQIKKILSIQCLPLISVEIFAPAEIVGKISYPQKIIYL